MNNNFKQNNNVNDRLIIEASIVNQNKLFLSRLIGELKRQAKKKDSVNTRNIQYTFNDKNYKTTVRASLEIRISDIKLAEVGNMIYILGVLSFTIVNPYYDYVFAHNTGRDLEEQVIDFVRYFAGIDKAPYISDQRIKDSLDAAGLSKISSSSDSSIKSSDIYKSLVSHAKEVENIEVHSNLHSDVAKKLKDREDVIPLLWIDAKDEIINHPYKYLGGSSNVTSGANRSRVRLIYNKDPSADIAGLASQSLQYTPYYKWLVFSTNDKVSDEERHFL